MLAALPPPWNRTFYDRAKPSLDAALEASRLDREPSTEAASYLICCAHELD